MTDRNDPPRVPRIPRTLLRLLTPVPLREQLDGDLRELYGAKRQRYGRLRADAWYWRQLLSLDVLRLALRGPRRRARRPRNVFPILFQDVRFGLRTFAKQPVFTAAAVLTLALGIGATTAIFTVVHTVLLRPLPHESPDELVMVFRTVPRFGFTRSTSSFPDFADWRAQTRSFRDMAAYGYTTSTYVDEDGATQWRGYRVTGNLFSLLGNRPALGRALTASDDDPSSSDVVVLSHSTWQSHFGADTTVVGRTITMDGAPVTVAGVMPREFVFPSRATQFWVPLRGNIATMERDSGFLTVIGRLYPDVAVEQAQVEMTAIAAEIDETMPNANRGYGIFLERRQDFIVHNARPALLIFMAAVGLVLLVALTNVANLMLARATTRGREIAVRTALGAGRGQIVRQMLTESTMLGVFGGVLGLAAAAVIVRVIVLFGSQQIPRITEIQMDPVVLLFVSLVSIVSGMIFGTVPAAIASRADPQRALKDAADAAGIGRSGRRFQQLLVVGEIAMAMTLTVAAALLLNSFARLMAVDPGFRPDHVVAGRVAAPQPPMDAAMAMSEADRAEVIAAQRIFYETLIERTQGRSGATAAGLSYGMPLGGFTFSRIIQPEGFTYEEGSEPVVDGNLIAADYFAALGIPLIRGRAFTEDDHIENQGVIIVNEAMAEAFWRNEDPLFKRVRIGNGERPWSTIVGVVANTVTRSLSEDPQPMYYRPYAQAPWPDAMYIVLRTTRPAEDVVRILRAELRDLDPSTPLTDVTTASQLVRESVAEPRFRVLVLSIVGFAAAVLALVGIYGVIAFTVEDRTREIGIRVALGANKSGVMRLVLGRGALLAVTGVAIGLVASAALTRFLKSMLYAVTPYDVTTFATCAVLMVALSILASYGPARRAATRDPLKVLRGDS